MKKEREIPPREEMERRESGSKGEKNTQKRKKRNTKMRQKKGNNSMRK